MVIGVSFGRGASPPVKLPPGQRSLDGQEDVFDGPRGRGLAHVQRLVEYGLEGLHDAEDVLAAVRPGSVDQGPLVHAVGHLVVIQLQVGAVLRTLKRKTPTLLFDNLIFNVYDQNY